MEPTTTNTEAPEPQTTPDARHEQAKGFILGSAPGVGAEADSQAKVGPQSPRPEGDPAPETAPSDAAPDDSAEADASADEEGRKPLDETDRYWMSKAQKLENEMEQLRQQNRQYADIQQILQDDGAVRALQNYFAGQATPSNPGPQGYPQQGSPQQGAGQFGQSTGEQQGPPESLVHSVGEDAAKIIWQQQQELQQLKAHADQMTQAQRQWQEQQAQQRQYQQAVGYLREQGLSPQQAQQFIQDVNDPQMSEFIRLNGIRGWLSYQQAPAQQVGAQQSAQQGRPPQASASQPKTPPPPAATAPGQAPTSNNGKPKGFVFG